MARGYYCIGELQFFLRHSMSEKKNMKKYFSSKWTCKNWSQILMNPSDVFINLFRAKSETYCYDTVISLLLPRFIHFQHQHTNLDTFWNLYSSIIFWQDLCRSSTCQPTFETLAPAEKLSTVSSPYMVFHEFSQFEQLKKKIIILKVQNRFFLSSVCQLK